MSGEEAVLSNPKLSNNIELGFLESFQNDEPVNEQESKGTVL